eukprot:CAMPEP_0117692164 /NCGR_PEP_ID=MMETSP0804-20121206/26161_1 /TAXON_ID=1074897 /ORGANISM="Tetraselmis astigmatica, Strain CCMP880" /LENGTH=262 /DNA_ID=CAMNT_0005505553 /DNA_START=108 /DNA_END=896 /DNA_ORIENTATION=+
MARKAIKAVLIDISGTLEVGRKEIPGSAAALVRLREAGFPVRFCTNTTQDTKANLVSLLRHIGLDVRPEEVFTSLVAAREMVSEQGLRPFLLLHPDAEPEFDGIDTANPNAVVVGLAKEGFTYDRMNAAFRLLMDGAELIGVHKGRYLKAVDGLALGPGPYVSALEFASGKVATVVGKPAEAFFRMALGDLCAPEEAVMIGDDAKDDIGGAKAAGLQALLVQTGKYMAGDEGRFGFSPDAVVEDFAAAADFVIAQGCNAVKS